MLAADLKSFIGSELLFGRPELSFSDDAELFGEGFVDSLGLMRLVAHLQEAYRIAVADEDLVPENFATVARLARFVERKRRGGP